MPLQTKHSPRSCVTAFQRGALSLLRSCLSNNLEGMGLHHRHKLVMLSVYVVKVCGVH
jgi:hypothetical protein